MTSFVFIVGLFLLLFCGTLSVKGFSNAWKSTDYSSDQGGWTILGVLCGLVSVVGGCMVAGVMILCYWF